MYLNTLGKGTIIKLRTNQYTFAICSKAYESQLDEYKLTANNDEREIVSLSGQCRALQHESEMTKEQLENCSEAVSDLKRKLAKANADSKLWKTKYEADALLRIDEMKNQYSKFKSKIFEEEQQREDLNSKCEMFKKANLDYLQ